MRIYRNKKDHIHLHMIISLKYIISKVVKTIKINTSKALKQKITFLHTVFCDNIKYIGKCYSILQ